MPPARLNIVEPISTTGESQPFVLVISGLAFPTDIDHGRDEAPDLPTGPDISPVAETWRTLERIVNKHLACLPEAPTRDPTGCPVPRQVDPQFFIDFVRDIIASARTDVSEYVLNWLAFKVQNPLAKPGVNLVLIGVQGVDKTALSEAFCDIFGLKLSITVSSEDHAFGHFNSHLGLKLVLVFDEAFYGGDPRIAGRYKSLTTSPMLPIEGKGVDVMRVPNYLAIMVLSNDIKAVPLEPGDRRATVIEVSADRKDDTNYFAHFWGCWENGGRGAVIEYLRKRDLAGFNPRIPLSTPEKADATLAAAEIVARWFSSQLDLGYLVQIGDWTNGPVTAPLQAIVTRVKQFAEDADYSGWRPTSHEIKSRLKAMCRGVKEGRRLLNFRIRLAVIIPQACSSVAMVASRMQSSAFIASH